MIMETNDDFTFERKSKMDEADDESTGMGAIDVELPAGNTWQQAGREMEIDGENICPKSLTGTF